MNKNFKKINTICGDIVDENASHKTYLKKLIKTFDDKKSKIIKNNYAHNITENTIARKKCVDKSKGNIMYIDNKLSYKSYSIFNIKSIILFCIFVFCYVVCLQPFFFTIFNGKAESITSNSFYQNAPIYIAGGAEINNNVVNMQSVQSLINKDGINKNVLQSLLNMINSNDVWKDEFGNEIMQNDNDVIYLSAKNFGFYNNNYNNDLQNGNSKILVKLFENSNDVNNTNNVNEFTNQLFQVVYRSLNDDNDVLTFYMTKSYITAQFNPRNETTIGEYTYKREGNYSVSLLRNQTVLPLYETLCSLFNKANLDNFVVAPYQLSSQNASDLIQTSNLPQDPSYYLNLGAWQCSLVQTSANANGDLVGADVSSSLGTSSYGDLFLNASAFSLGNGLDGLNVSSIPSGTWASNMVSAYKDKLWVPSSFEVMHTGHYYGTTTNIVNTNKSFDNEKSISVLENAENLNTNLDENIGNTRTGLWELNAYDRAEDGVTWSWVR